jgi:hypothetical protein
MGLKDQAKADIERITSDTDEWASPLTFIAPGGETAEITGTFFERNLEVLDKKGNGNTTNTQAATAGVSEKHLTDVDYPVRDDDNEVNLAGHKIVATNSAGIESTYRIAEWKQDQAVGYIVCILEAYTE